MSRCVSSMMGVRITVSVSVISNQWRVRIFCKRKRNRKR